MICARYDTISPIPIGLVTVHCRTLGFGLKESFIIIERIPETGQKSAKNVQVQLTSMILMRPATQLDPKNLGPDLH